MWQTAIFDIFVKLLFCNLVSIAHVALTPFKLQQGSWVFMQMFHLDLIKQDHFGFFPTFSKK